MFRGECVMNEVVYEKYQPNPMIIKKSDGRGDYSLYRFWTKGKGE